MARATAYVMAQVYGPYDPGQVISGAEFTDDELDALVKDGVLKAAPSPKAEDKKAD